MKVADLEAIFEQHGVFDPSGHSYATNDPYALLHAVIKEVDTELDDFANNTGF